MVSKINTIIITVLGILFFSSSVWAASYYVDATSGNDSNVGTQAAPWKTVSKVNGAALRAGDFIYFKRGSTWNTLLYPASGTSGSPVTYGAYGTGNKPIIRGFYADRKSYIRVQDLEFNNNSGDIPFLIYNSSHHISVNNCNIYAGPDSSAYVALWLSTNANYNEITNCDVQIRNLNIQNDAINLRRNANYNIIKGNNILSGTHVALALEGSDAANPNYTCSYNVIQDNNLEARNGGGLALISNSNSNLFENNVITGGKASSMSMNLARSLKVVSKNNIVRRNIVRDNTGPGSSGISTEVYQYNSDPANIATGNHIYNNIVTNVGEYPMVIATNSDPGAAAYNNYYKNNIVYNNGAAYSLWIMKHSTIYDNFFSHNSFYKEGSDTLQIEGNYTNIAGIQSTDPSHFWGNIQQDPQLDANYKPLPGSPVIDAGDFLTKVTSSNNTGTSFTVEDAGYFFDGYGLVAGDTIQIGGAVATINNIDYNSNTITVNSSVSWTKGMNVSLPYTGSRPDMGVFEDSTNSPTLKAPSNLRIIN